jgi:phage-related protein (TIGR01555 family)
MKYSDSFINLLTELGLNADKSRFSGFKERTELDWDTLAAMYEQDAISARIIDRLPDDATREEITIKGTDEDFDFASVQSELEDLKARTHIGDAWRWARLYQGALLIMNINDGGKMSDPLNIEAATKLSSLHVVEAQYIQPTNFNPGLGSSAFSNPENYLITVPFSTTEARTIHRSRVIRFDGVKVSPSRMINSGGWGPSVLDRIRTDVMRLGTVMGYAEAIMHDISIQAVQLEGLREMLCGDVKSQADAKRVIEALRFAMDNLHLVAIDAKDKYIEITRTVAGLNELIEKFVDALVRATDMPRTVLLGEQPGGLNASGDSEIRAWYDFVAAQQPRVLTPAISRLLEVIFAIRSKKEKVPDEWTIEYEPLWQPSAEQTATTEKTQMETVTLGLDAGLVSVDEGRSKLKSQGYLPEDAPDEPPEDEREVEALREQLAALASAQSALPPSPEQAPEIPEQVAEEPDEE